MATDGGRLKRNRVPGELRQRIAPAAERTLAKTIVRMTVKPFQRRVGNHVPAPGDFQAARFRKLFQRSVADRVRDTIADVVDAH